MFILKEVVNLPPSFLIMKNHTYHQFGGETLDISTKTYNTRSGLMVLVFTNTKDSMSVLLRPEYDLQEEKSDDSSRDHFLSVFETVKSVIDLSRDDSFIKFINSYSDKDITFRVDEETSIRINNSYNRFGVTLLKDYYGFIDGSFIDKSDILKKLKEVEKIIMRELT